MPLPSSRTLILLVGLAGPGTAWAQDAASTEGGLPLAPLIAALVGVIVFVAYRVRAWVRTEVEPALADLRGASTKLRERAEPPRLRAFTPAAPDVGPVLQRRILVAGGVTLVGAEDGEPAVRALADLLEQPGGTVLLAVDGWSDDELAQALSARGAGLVDAASRRLLRVDAEELAAAPEAGLAGALLWPAPLTVVVVVPRRDDFGVLNAELRDLAARFELAARPHGAAVLVCVPMAPEARGWLRVLAEAPGVVGAWWFDGGVLVSPLDEPTTEGAVGAG